MWHPWCHCIGINLIWVHLSKFKFISFNFLQIYQMPLVKEHWNLLCKWCHKKLYLGMLFQDIILVNFWDFSQKVWTPLKFKTNSNSRRFLNLLFTICFVFEVWPKRKVVTLDLLYIPKHFHDFWKPGRASFWILNSNTGFSFENLGNRKGSGAWLSMARVHWGHARAGDWVATNSPALIASMPCRHLRR
jgi:hypothetical protein